MTRPYHKKDKPEEVEIVNLDPLSKIVIAPPINDNDGEMFSSLDNLIEIAKMKAREMDLIVEQLEVLRGRFKGKS